MAGKLVHANSGAKMIKMSNSGVPRLSHLVLLLFLVPCVLGQPGMARCDNINCKAVCTSGLSNYQPQRCDECCVDQGQPDSQDSRLQKLEATVKELRILVVVVMVLVLVILLGGGALICYYCLHRSSSLSLPLFLKGRAARAKAKEAHRMETKTTPPQDNMAGRIANHQNKHSPLNSRAASNRRPTVRSIPGDVPPISYSSGRRVRQPSESSSPDDPSTTPTTTTPTPQDQHPHAYHNLALSTSTLHDSTISSNSTLAAAVSTNTLDTTLASVPAQNEVNLDNVPSTRI